MYEKLKEIKNREKLEAEKAYNEKSLQALKRLVKTRCTTIFIGALDSIEQKFGYQWGQGESFSDLTDKEKLFLQLWKNLRKEILDKGNLQTKTLLKELELFEVLLKENSYEFGDFDHFSY